MKERSREPEGADRVRGPVLIFGANGFLGRYACRHFARRGREVVAVARRRKGWSGDGMFLEWDGRTLAPWVLALEGAALVLNFSGRSVNCRCDRRNREQVLESRISTTRIIGEAIAGCRQPPKLWIHSSTAAWYRHGEDRPQSEWRGEAGQGFSAEVARGCEESFFGARVPSFTRKVALRTGMVLANEADTTFDILFRLIKRGLGGRMGRGTQRVSWIHMGDFLGAIEEIEADMMADGVWNLVAPGVATNSDMMRGFRELYGMPVGLSMSRQMMEIGALLMRSEAELMLRSRWVTPERLVKKGFVWRWPELQPALDDLARRRGLQEFFRIPERRSVGCKGWVGGRTKACYGRIPEWDGASIWTPK